MQLLMRSSIEAELWAINEGLRLWTDNNWLPLILETDSLMAYNCLYRI